MSLVRSLRIAMAVLMLLGLWGCNEPSEEQILAGIKQRKDVKFEKCPDNPTQLCTIILSGEDDRPVTIMGGSVILTGGRWSRALTGGGQTDYFEYIETSMANGFQVSDVRLVGTDEDPNHTTGEDSILSLPLIAGKALNIDVRRVNLFSDKVIYTLLTNPAGGQLHLIPENKNFSFTRFLKRGSHKINRITFANVTVPAAAMTDFGCSGTGTPASPLLCPENFTLADGTNQSLGVELLFMHP